MSIRKILVYTCLACFGTWIAGCAPTLSSQSYDASEVGVSSHVVPGLIIGKRVIAINNNSGMGGLAGTAAGAAAGSQFGGNGAMHVVGAVGGAVVGGVMGNELDKSAHHQVGYEYIIRLEKQKLISVVQPQDADFSIGQKVLVMYGVTTRIIPEVRPDA